MRIAYDTRWIRTSNLEGIGGYSLELLSHLLEIDRSNSYLFFFENEDRLRFFRRVFKPERYGNCAVEFVNISLASIRGNIFSLPKFLNERNIDIYHAPYYFFTPIKSRYRIIATAYDLIPFLYPRYSVRDCPMLKFIYGNRWFARLISRRADRFISSSNYSIDYLNRNFGVSKDKMNLVYPGIANKFRPVTDESYLAGIRRKYGLPKDYILFMGEAGRHKNIPILIDSYLKLSDGLRNKHKLVIIPRGEKRDVEDEIRAIGREKLAGIVMPGYVHLEDKPAIYGMARAFVYPTFYDGFPLHVLEAMACGIPVITSDIPTMNEFVGDAAQKFDPGNGGSIKDAMEKTLSDDQLRHDLGRKGMAQAARFSWPNAARQVLEIYNDVSGK